MSDLGISSNANKVAADLLAHGMRAGARSVSVTRHFGMLLQAAVKRRASLPRGGPPGPRIITGNYNRSIGLQLGMAAGGAVARVGSNAPQARRLEEGFNDTDSLGRTYEQPPYPHYGPALDEIGPLFVAAIAAIGTPDDTPLTPAAPQTLTYITRSGREREATQAQIDHWTRGQN